MVLSPEVLIPEPKGVVYTKPWVVDLILDLAGYRSDHDLADRVAVEPAAGEGAFLAPMIGRLLDSIESHGRKFEDARTAIRAYEVDDGAAALVTNMGAEALRRRGVSTRQALNIAEDWLTVGDYLFDSRQDRPADIVVGNPPYIRYDDLPDDLFAQYRQLYPTMVGRCDIYVGFIEAGIRQLKEGGVLGFICADRWMRSAYGAELRRFVSDHCGVDVVIEMHNAPAFVDDVAAYPAVILIRRGPQRRSLVASGGSAAGPLPSGANLADALIGLADGKPGAVPGFSATRIDSWFKGDHPWPSLEPRRLELLQSLEAKFPLLEDKTTGTKVGIGVATGADRVYVTTDSTVAEQDRLLPLAMAADTRSGKVEWSGHYLVNPWTDDGQLVDLDQYPMLRAYLEANRGSLEDRNIAKRKRHDWYRTIDKVNHKLTARDKLYFPDMKLRSNPTLDRGETYPHHNVYFLVSDAWDLEVLGGLLLSRVAQMFIEAYCVKMRGGTLRFQAQYLRRIRVPDPSYVSETVAHRLRQAFRSRDADAATEAAAEAYGIEPLSC